VRCILSEGGPSRGETHDIIVGVCILVSSIPSDTVSASVLGSRVSGLGFRVYKGVWFRV
jgi:hypothetical protein